MHSQYRGCWWHGDGRDKGFDSIQRCHLTSIGNPIVEIRRIWICHLTIIGNPIMKIRRSDDRLISTMGFPILVRWHLYIETGPRASLALVFTLFSRNILVSASEMLTVSGPSTIACPKYLTTINHKYIYIYRYMYIYTGWITFNGKSYHFILVGIKNLCSPKMPSGEFFMFGHKVSTLVWQSEW